MEAAALEKQAIEEPGVALRERVEGVGQGEDDVEVLESGRTSRAAGGEPAFVGQRLAFGAVPVAARVVGDLLGAAGVADVAMAAERGGAAGRDGAHGAALGAGQRVGGAIRRAMGAEDVGQLHPVGPRRADAAGARAPGARLSAPGGSGRSRGEPVASTRPRLR